MQWRLSALTALEATTFASLVFLSPTSLPHFIGLPTGLEDTLPLSPYIHWALCYVLVIVVNHALPHGGMDAFTLCVKLGC